MNIFNRLRLWICDVLRCPHDEILLYPPEVDAQPPTNGVAVDLNPVTPPRVLTTIEQLKEKFPDADVKLIEDNTKRGMLAWRNAMGHRFTAALDTTGNVVRRASILINDSNAFKS